MPSLHHIRYPCSVPLRRLPTALCVCLCLHGDHVMGNRLRETPLVDSKETSDDLTLRLQRSEVTSRRPELTTQDKTELKMSWDSFKRDFYFVAKDMYNRMILDYPYVAGLFHKATGYEPLMTTESLATGHAQRVVFAVDKLIERMDGESDNWISYIYTIGYRHGEVSIRVEYFDLFVPYFMESLHRLLDQTTPPDLRATWANFFAVVIYHLKDANSF